MDNIVSRSYSYRRLPTRANTWHKDFSDTLYLVTLAPKTVREMTQLPRETYLPVCNVAYLSGPACIVIVNDLAAAGTKSTFIITYWLTPIN